MKITEADWQGAQDEMIEDDRRTLGAPPTAEELDAYSRGELTGEDEARIRALLVAYPALARAMAVPFPADGEDAVPAEEVSRRWDAFQAEVRPRGKVLPFWHASAALAATLALVFGALVWRETSRRAPRVLSESEAGAGGVVLFSSGRRGPGKAATVISGDGGKVLIVPLYENPSRVELELVDADDKVLWRSGVVPPRTDGTVHVELPPAYLEPGAYRVVVRGQPLAYPIRVR